MSGGQAEEPDGADIRVERNVLIPLSDGVELAADLYLPALPGRYPALMSFYPYRKDDVIGGACEYARRYFTRHGYASLLVDFRGTGSSEGAFAENFDTLQDGKDGAEVVEWAAAQSWCDGAVGVYGLSYGGIMAMAIAAQRPKHLRAIAPMHGPPNIWRDWIAPGGCPNCLGNYAREVFMLALDLAPPTHQDANGRWLRVWKERLQRLRDGKVHTLRWPEHRHYDEYWQRRAVPLEQIEVPSYIIGSWRELFPEAVPLSFQQIAVPKRLLMGPWLHVPPDFSTYEPVEWLDGLLRWWDRWLRNEDNGAEHDPPVTIFVQGSEQWRNEQEWPPARAETRVLWPAADGSLGDDPGEKAEHTYVADPTVGTSAGLADPLGTGVGYPLDQSQDDRRSLTYTTEPLAEAIEVTGSPAACVSVALDRGSELQLVAKLNAVSPDGVSTLVSTGWLNGEHRDGAQNPKPLELGMRYDLRIPMGATSYVVPKGSRLRLAIACSDFPRIWPTHENPVIRVFVGDGAQTALHLPTVRTDQPAPAGVQPIDPEVDRTPWNVEATPAWRISRDLIDDGISVEFGTSAVMQPPSGTSLHLHHRSVAAVARRSPEGAHVETHAGMEIRLPAREEVEIATHGRFTRDTLFLEGRVTVDGDVIFEGHWGT